MATVTGFTADRMLAIENSSVVDGDVVGDNLILHTHGGTDINAGNVRGPVGPAGNPFGAITELGNAVNLNSIISSGYYTQQQDAEAASGLNYPAPYSGLLEVVAAAGGAMIWQKYTVVAGSPMAGMIFARSYSGSWTSWSLVGGPIPYSNHHKATPISPASTAVLILDYDGQDNLEGGMSYNAGVLTVPIAGKYMINAAMHLQSTATIGFSMSVRKNNVNWRQLNFKHDGLNASYTIDTTLPANANDNFSIAVNVPAAGNTIYGVAPGIRYTYFDVTWVGG